MPRTSGAAVQPVTPRKRKTGSSDAPTPASRGKGKARGPPTPNPPLAPFPTPPSSRHRDPNIVSHFSFDESTSSLASEPSPSYKPLPPHLETLHKLHHAFNLALSLHFATHPPVLPPHPTNTTKLELINLTNFLSVKGTIERTAGRKFGLPELGRLAWLWMWDGEALPEDNLVSLNAKQEEEKKQPVSPRRDVDNPFLVRDSTPSERQSICGLSYVITPTRTLDPGSGRRVHTYGFGIELDLKPGETRNLLSELDPGGSRGQGGGAGAIARWNGNGDMREREVRQRLDKWVELHGGYDPPGQTDLPTPQTTSNQRSTIPPIPLLPLPKLPTATLLPSANLFSAVSAPPVPRPSSTSIVPGLADPFVMDDKDKTTKIVRPGSVEERRKAMMDRIKARSGSSRGPTLGSSIGQLDSIRPRPSQSAQAEELKRRSTLSRLEGIAEAIWMMFSSPSPGPNTLPTPPRGRRKAIPLGEVADIIVKSSKTPISLAEAQDSIKLLSELCPFFLTLKVVAKQEWVEMPSAALATCPSSPGSGLSAVARMTPQSYPSPSAKQVSTPPGPSTPRSRVVDEPVSPSPNGRTTTRPVTPTSPTSRDFDRAASPSPIGRTRLPRPPESPTLHKSPRLPSSPSFASKAQLAGPASPGRVKRYGGLRQVRERIRLELGE